MYAIIMTQLRPVFYDPVAVPAFNYHIRPIPDSYSGPMNSDALCSYFQPQFSKTIIQVSYTSSYSDARESIQILQGFYSRELTIKLSPSSLEKYPVQAELIDSFSNEWLGVSYAEDTSRAITRSLHSVIEGSQDPQMHIWR